MKVSSVAERAENSRKMVFEMLMADQPARDVAHEHDSKFWQWSDRLGLDASRLPARAAIAGDTSHPAMRVQLDGLHPMQPVRARLPRSPG